MRPLSISTAAKEQVARLEERLEHLRQIFRLLSDINVTLDGTQIDGTKVDGRKLFLGYPSVILLSQKVDSLLMATTINISRIENGRQRSPGHEFLRLQRTFEEYERAWRS